MGEQSTRALRGGKMEDVIFGGTAKRKQLGFAEVSLVLDNTGGLFDREESEIMVTRRYYRSGESEYLLNGQSVRLRDVNELFMDTGLGQEGYASSARAASTRSSPPRAPSGGRSLRRRRGSPTAATRRRRPSASWSAPRKTWVRIGDKLEELDLQRPPESPGPAGPAVPGPGPVSGHRRRAAAAGVGPPAGDSGPAPLERLLVETDSPMCCRTFPGGQQKISGQSAQLLPAAAPDH